MKTEGYYSTRRGFNDETEVVYCSAHTGDVKAYVSTHNNSANARKRADKLNREAAKKNALTFN